jgi:hypothetical protein
MDDHDIAAAREVLRGIKLFWCLDDADIAIKRLGGLTNQVFFVDHAGEQYVSIVPMNCRRRRRRHSLGLVRMWCIAM